MDFQKLKNIFWVCKCYWLKAHNQKNYFGFNCPIKIWDTELEPTINNQFIPLKFIKGHVALCKENVSFDNFTDVVNLIFTLPTRSILSCKQ